MPRRKSTRSLRHIALVSIAKSMDFWCKEFVENFKGHKLCYVIGPFDCLPQSVLNDLFSVLRELKLLRRPHLNLLIHPGTDTLDLSRTATSEIIWPSYTLNLVGNVCRNLKHLNLSCTSKISQNVYIELARSIPSIITLNLRSTDCNDAVLSALGGHCPELRELDVSWCRITDIGISSLCINMDDVEFGGHRRCQKITRLCIQGTEVSDDGSMTAMCNLPSLRIFECANNSRALLALHGGNMSSGWIDETPSYRLETLHCNCEVHEVIEPDALKVAIAVCPNITKVTLDNVNMSDADLLLLTGFIHLKELSLGNGPSSGVSFDNGLAPLLSINGGRMTSLHLVELHDVDVHVIGSCCPQLQTLHLLYIGGYSSKNGFQQIERPFEHLRQIHLVCTETSDIPPDQLRLLLSHCNHLEGLYLQRCQTLTDSVLSGIISSNPLPRLTDVELEYCNSLTVASIVSLFSSQNPLRSLKTWWCKGLSKQDSIFLQDRVKRENLDTTIQWS